MTLRIFAAIVAVSVGACGGTTPEPTEPEINPHLRAGTSMHTRLQTELDARQGRVGQRFRLTVMREVRAENGAVIVPVPSVVTGRVTGVDLPTRGNPGAIAVLFDTILVRNRIHRLNATVVSTDVASARSSQTRARVTVPRDSSFGSVISKDRAGIFERLEAPVRGSVIGLGSGALVPRLPADMRIELRVTKTIDLSETPLVWPLPAPGTR